MNIAELPIAGITLAQPDSSSTVGALSDMPEAARFGNILSGLLNQHPDFTQVGTSTPGSLLQSLLSLAGTNNIQNTVLTLMDGQGNSFEQLGQKLLSLVAQLLEGGSDDVKTDELMPLLDSIISSLTLDQNADGTKDTLIRLFANVKQSLAGGKLSLKLEDIVNGLPELLKLKIRLSGHNGGKQLSGQEAAHIQFMLVTKLIGLADQIPGVDSGSQSSNASENIVTRLSDKLMAKFHITPGLANATQDSNNGDTGSVDTPVPAIDPSRIETPNDQTSGNVGEGSAPVHNQKGDSVQAKPQGMPAAGPSDTLAKAVDPQQAVDRPVVNGTVHDKPVPQGHDVVHGATKVTTPTEAANAETALTDSQSGDQSTADSGTTAVNSNSSTSPYAVGGDNRQGFANEIGQAMRAGTTGNAGAPQAAINAEHLLKQVVEKFDVLVAGGRSEAKIQLKPKHLGELNIHLVMENGTMRAVLDAPSHQIKEVLESNLSSLKQSLEDQGFHVQGFDVSVGHRQNNHNRGFARFNGARFMGERHTESMAKIERAGTPISLNGYGHKVVNYLA